MKKLVILIIALLPFLSSCSLQIKSSGTKTSSFLEYTVSLEDAAAHKIHVDLRCKGWGNDSVVLKMARWMPGYYQLMDYSKNIENFSATGKKGKILPVTQCDESTWIISAGKNSPFVVSYDLKADMKFVANNFSDSAHAYILPAATFLYIKDHINIPVIIKVNTGNDRTKIATGLERIPGKQNEFSAPDFDVLFDCPILSGNLEELQHFEINGIKHRFIAYNPGTFNRDNFMSDLKKVVVAGVNIFGDIPYNEFTFIGIGRGRGGIEHLNNTTVSFNGDGLEKRESMIRMMNFLAHEYFHNYNVKRIRPFELGPFDYDKENRTNLLWVSEGLSVYYEYMMVKRAGLINQQEMLRNFEYSINAFENDPGRNYESLVQASYNTWSEGPFGNSDKTDDRSISYYDKGPVVGLILDLTIRNATQNQRSLDDVMRYLYQHYYKHLHRGFTDSEFQQACEHVAGKALTDEFEYVYTTGQLDYNKYLSYCGLKVNEEKDQITGKRKFIRCNFKW